MPDMFYNDSGIVRKIRKLFYNDSGIVREIKKAWYCDGNVWRLVFDSVVVPPPPVDPPGEPTDPPGEGPGDGGDPGDGVYTITQGKFNDQYDYEVEPGEQHEEDATIYVDFFGYSGITPELNYAFGIRPQFGSISPDQFNGSRILEAFFSITTADQESDQASDHFDFTLLIEGVNHGQLRITPEGAATILKTPSIIPGSRSLYTYRLDRPAIWDGSGNVTLSIEKV